MTRIACAAPGCRRTHHNREGFAEWLCPRHWSLVPKYMRRAYASAKRRKKPGTAINRIWRRCKRAAVIETFMGI